MLLSYFYIFLVLFGYFFHLSVVGMLQIQHLQILTLSIHFFCLSRDYGGNTLRSPATFSSSFKRHRGVPRPFRRCKFSPVCPMSTVEGLAIWSPAVEADCWDTLTPIFCLFRVAWVAGAHLSCHRAKGRVHPGRVASLANTPMGDFWVWKVKPVIRCSQTTCLLMISRGWFSLLQC